MAEQKRWVIYYDETFLKKMNRLRQEAADKDHVPFEEMSVSEVVKKLADEKYVEYVDLKNNRARITLLANNQAEIKQAFVDMQIQLLELTTAILSLIAQREERQEKVEAALRELTALIMRMEGD